MISNIKRLELRLSDETTPGLLSLGYERQAGKQLFRKYSKQGWGSFHLSFIEHSVDVDVTCDVAVRIDAVEEVLVQRSKLLTKADKDQQATLGVELGNLISGQPHRYHVNETNVCEVSREMVSVFETIGDAYVTKYSNYEDALEILGCNDRHGWLHSPFHGLRCQRALTLAYLLKNKERFDLIAERSIDFLKSRKDPGLSAFEELVANLSGPSA